MKVVIISRTCYPAKAPRSYRATELAKEFVKRGHEVSLYAFLGSYDYSEISAQTGIHFKNLGKARFGMSSNTKKIGKSKYHHFLRYVGRPFHFPECTMIPMVKKAIRNEGDIDLLITIAIPHVIHYAASVSDLSKVKNWIADCGDPFMGNPFHKQPSYFERFERHWCERCNYITIPIQEATEAYYPEYRDKIRVIPQGFDFNGTTLAEYVPNKAPTFAYSGIFFKDLRDPTRFLTYLSTLQSDFKFICYTKSKGMLEPFRQKLGDKLEIRDYVPREELIYELSKMDFLVNVVNSSGVQQPSKLIDYSIAKRPVLSVTSSFPDYERVVFEEFLQGNYVHKHPLGDVERYNIINVVNQIMELLK